MRLAVVGDPVDHSLSPAIHTAALAAAGIAGSYARIRVDAAGMADVTAAIRRGELDGVNVTMPLKGVAYALVDHAAGPAVRTGAVNTVVRVGDRLVGHNTDVAGMAAAWRRAGLPLDRPVVVFGGGGAAAAALVALEDLAAGPVVVAGRRPEALAELVGSVGATASVAALGSVDVTGTVVVNCTPIGMGGEDLALDVRTLAGLFDMAYRATDPDTPAVHAARGAGVPAVGGLAMLVAQAVEAFRLWTGREASVATMLAAVGPAGVA